MPTQPQRNQNPIRKNLCKAGPNIPTCEKLMARIPVSKQILGLLGWLVLTFAAAAIGGAASPNAGAFYQQLNLPGWAPPAWLFAPAWSVLYLLMGIAAWDVWRARGLRGARTGLSLFIIQLGANALWTWLYFAWHQGAWAFAEIIILWALILGTLVAFWRVRPLAGVLLLPYLVWVTFASALTYTTWQRNPQLLAQFAIIEMPDQSIFSTLRLGCAGMRVPNNSSSGPRSA